jgi:hypothetical protein
MGGKPCIRGLGFTVYDLAAGMTEDEILRDFPYLQKADLFPDSVHVNSVQLGSTPDVAVWTSPA